MYNQYLPLSLEGPLKGQVDTHLSGALCSWDERGMSFAGRETSPAHNSHLNTQCCPGSILGPAIGKLHTLGKITL